MARKNANNEGSIRKRSNGTWEGRVTVGFKSDGKQNQRSVYGRTRKEVSEKLNELKLQICKGIYIAPSSITLKEWMNIWLQEYAKNNIRPSTYISYEGYIFNHIIPALGHYPIQTVTVQMIQNFYNEKYENGNLRNKKGLSPKTLHNLHNMFHKAMEQAFINGMIYSNPTTGVTLPRNEHKERRVLSVEEENRLIQVLSTHRLGMAILFDLSTGLRIGELCALKWSDVNFSKRTVRISRTLQRIKKSMVERLDLDNELEDDEIICCNLTSIVEGPVKTQNGMREIPVPDIIFDNLMKYKQAQDMEKKEYGNCYIDNGYIFATPCGGCIEPSYLRDVLNVLLSAAQVEHANFHALRHTFATRALENGMDVKTLSVILGHSQVQITMDLYCHASIDHMKIGMNAISGMFSQAYI